MAGPGKDGAGDVIAGRDKEERRTDVRKPKGGKLVTKWGASGEKED